MRYSSVETALLRTLLYADLFDFPLTQSELLPRLIAESSSGATLRQALASLVARKRIGKTGVYYHLPGRSRLVAVRSRRSRTTATKLQEAKRIAGTIARFPGVLAVCATGSLAAGNATSAADLDFLVLTAPHCLWCLRPFLVALVHFLGKRRFPASRFVSNTACLNLWLSTEALSLPKSQQSLFAAYELMQIKPLVDRSGWGDRLLLANPWVLEYLPNCSFPKPLSYSLAGKALPVNPSLLPGLLAQLLNRILFFLQYLYMRPRLTNERVGLEYAYFHPRNLALGIMGKLSSRQKRYRLNLWKNDILHTRYHKTGSRRSS